jgi:hypothetical protein
MKTLMVPAAAVAMVATLAACSDKGVKQAREVSLNNDDFFEVHHDGRLHMFDDAKTYLSYLQLGETTFRLTRIGAGPKGETVVFGLTKADKKKTSGIASVDMFDGKLAGGTPFYGEMVKHGRIYVFSTWEDMKYVRELGHPAYMYTAIGSGPKGETVVYVLNKTNKKHKPADLIDRFQKLHSI